MNIRGMTLTEVLVVVSVIGILVIAMGFQFMGWYAEFKVESATKDIYADLLEARLRAAQRNRPYFADFNVPPPPAGQGRYRIAEAGNIDIGGTLYVNAAGDADNNGRIDGGHVIQPTFPKQLEYSLTWNRACLDDGCGIITFDKKGILNAQKVLTPPAMDTTVGTLCITNNGDLALTSDLIQDELEGSPDYDCIVLGQSRINMGKLTQNARRGIILNGNAGMCVERNQDVNGHDEGCTTK